MGIINDLRKKAEGLNKRIIFPEGADERIIKAAKIAEKRKIIKPILVDKIDLSKIKKYAGFYSRLTKTGIKTAEQIAKQHLFYSALALKSGDADGMVGGAVYTSGDFIAVCKEVIGLKKGFKAASSFFLMEIPEYKGGEKGVLMYADASVNPNPNAEELADIAVVSGNTAKTLLKWEPRVAVLSFSTKGSAEHADVEKARKAVEIAKRKAKGIDIDGEFQVDSALVMDVAKRKIKRNIGKVAGRANVLIFPDLDAGNIAYKLTQRLAKAKAYGPILQGFNKPLSDLSRGANVEDIVGVIAIVAIIADRQGFN